MLTGPSLLLRGASLPDGSRADIQIADGRITAISDSAAVADSSVIGSASETATTRVEPRQIDCAGYVVLPAAVEPHAHLDKALTADLVPNPAGDLLGAIEAWHRHRTTLTVADVADRAERAALMGLQNGTTLIRTHVDVGVDVGTVPVEGVVEARRRLAGLVDIEIVALVGIGHGDRAVLADALAAGADVVGGCPHLDPDPIGCITWALEHAGATDRAVDLHMDETLDPGALWLRDLARLVESTGFAHPVAASHCVSLGMHDVATQHEVAAAVAAAGISVVTLPQTNLFLQGRDRPVATPRGLTALRPLLDAGANVAGGGDNLQDPFNTMGRADAFETAALLVMAAHLPVDEAVEAVTAAGRRALARTAVSLAVGSPADLVAVPARSLREAVASAPLRRLVIHRGRVVVDLDGTVARWPEARNSNDDRASGPGTENRRRESAATC